MKKPPEAMSGTIIRELSPVDLDAVAKVHCAAFPGSAITALGPQVARRYYAWLLLGPHDAVAIGAESDSQLAGFCFGGIFRGSMAGFLQRNRALLFRKLLLRPWLLGNELIRSRIRMGLKSLLRRRRRGVPSGLPGCAPSFGILSIAVDPRRQGKGAGKSLIAYCEASARQRGFEQMHLTVEPENRQAIAFYERLGWQRALEAGVWKGRMIKRLTL
jgi:ribosomal protein S18 acetylase RimI-like enzyme